MRTLSIVAIIVLLSACAVDRYGTGEDDAAQVSPDAQETIDAAIMQDARLPLCTEPHLPDAPCTVVDFGISPADLGRVQEAGSDSGGPADAGTATTDSGVDLGLPAEADAGLDLGPPDAGDWLWCHVNTLTRTCYCYSTESVCRANAAGRPHASECVFADANFCASRAM